MTGSDKQRLVREYQHERLNELSLQSIINDENSSAAEVAAAREVLHSIEQQQQNYQNHVARRQDLQIVIDDS
ncbi:MAG: hypothetical protein V4519_02530 [Patescibacteria group bacterium]